MFPVMYETMRDLSVTLYNPISRFYKERFGEKVRKLPLILAQSCPNREGLKGMKTCIFCDEWGSAAYSKQQGRSLASQIEELKSTLSNSNRIKKFIAYFQAYTNSFLKLGQLIEAIEFAQKDPQICGIIIGTRPDCLSAALLEMLQKKASQMFVGIELGVQSFNDDQLKFLERGHTAQDSLRAIERIAREAPDVDLGLHFMFGLPKETKAEIIEQALICNRLPISNVKLHNLHVLRGTPLEEQWRAGLFSPIELREYAELVALFLENLSPKIYVHRLVALSSRWDELLAPEWTRYRMRNHQFILDELSRLQTYQGRCLAQN